MNPCSKVRERFWEWSWAGGVCQWLMGRWCVSVVNGRQSKEMYVRDLAYLVSPLPPPGFPPQTFLHRNLNN